MQYTIASGVYYNLLVIIRLFRRVSGFGIFLMETLGERIKFLRGAQSQRWLAEQLNIPQTTLSNYENNKVELNFSMIDAFITLFHVKTDWLLFGRGEIWQKDAAPEPDDTGARIRQLEKLLLEAKEGEKEAWKEAAMAYRLAAVVGRGGVAGQVPDPSAVTFNSGGEMG